MVVHIYNLSTQEAEMERFLVRPAWAVQPDPTSKTDKQKPKLRLQRQPVKDATDKICPYHCNWHLTEQMRQSSLMHLPCPKPSHPRQEVRRDFARTQEILTKALTLAAGPDCNLWWEMPWF